MMANLSSVPPRTVAVVYDNLGDLSKSIEILRCQREAADLLVASRLANLENVRNYLDAANETILRGIAALTPDLGEILGYKPM